MVSDKKTSQVDSLIKLIDSSRNFALVKFEKTLHTTLESLRKDLKANGGNLKVIKNALFEKALNKVSGKNEKLHQVQKEFKKLTENSAFLMLGEDWSKALAAFHRFTKNEPTLGFKIGFLENRLYRSEELKKIAQLPGRDELIAKVIGSMKSPVARLNFAIKFNMQKFVYILNEKSKRG